MTVIMGLLAAFCGSAIVFPDEQSFISFNSCDYHNQEVTFHLFSFPDHFLSMLIFNRTQLIKHIYYTDTVLVPCVFVLPELKIQCYVESKHNGFRTDNHQVESLGYPSTALVTSI